MNLNLSFQSSHYDQIVEVYPLYRDISLAVPESYEYFYINEKDAFIQSEYARALNECLAKKLTQRYLNEQRRGYHNWYAIELEQYFNKGIFDNYLLTGGVTEDELSQLAKLSEENAVKKAIQQIINHSITTADETA